MVIHLCVFKWSSMSFIQSYIVSGLDLFTGMNLVSGCVVKVEPKRSAMINWSRIFILMFKIRYTI